MRLRYPDWTLGFDAAVEPHHISLLGPFRVRTAAGQDITPSSRRAQAVIAMIALSERGERSRSWLHSRLWSDRPADQASASLRQELTKLRRLMGPAYLTTELDRVALKCVKVDVIEIFHSGTVAATFLSAEAPELLEGLQIRDEAFEDWVRLERANWQSRIEELAGAVGSEMWHKRASRPPTAPALTTFPSFVGPTGKPVPPEPRVPFAVPIRVEPTMCSERPTLGILPCVVRAASADLAAVGELTCDLMSKLLIENGTLDVFDFRDLSHASAGGGLDASSKPSRGPDLLATVRLTEVAGMIEIAVGIRRVENGRLIWTQSYASDGSVRELMSGGRVADCVNQAIEAVELWTLRHTPDDQHSACRLLLAASHRLFCIQPIDLDVAQEQLERSFALDPASIQLGWLALLECIREGEEGVGIANPQRKDSVRSLTARALEIERGNSLTLALLGHANAFILRDYEVAENLLSEAIRINPYRAASWDALAMLNIYTGRIEEGYKAALHGRALGQHSPYAFWYNASCQIAAALLDRHEEAVRYGRLVLCQRPDFRPALRHLIASYAALGDIAKAQTTLAHLRALEPSFDAASLATAHYPLPSPRSIAAITDGLTAVASASQTLQ